MTTSEKLLERQLVKECKAAGAWAIKLLPFQFAGLPDRMVLQKGGRVFFVEVKTTGKEPSPAQLRVHGKLRGLGFRVYILDRPEQLQIIKNQEGLYASDLYNRD